MSPDASGASAAPDVPAYASTKLIAYLGNKRALLPFLLSVFRELDGELPISSFLDPFAGSGAVSRLARSLGWSVMANDSEEYSRAVNEAWLGVSADELPRLFAEEGGLASALEALNGLHPGRGDEMPPCRVEPYIAAHYAPADTSKPDWRRERLFYTRENAVFLDRARCAVEYMRPRLALGEAPRAFVAERALLLGLLVYEAATHANTSGVFKAYHKGFGGHGGDALGRILKPMRLEPPILWEGLPPSWAGKAPRPSARGGAPTYATSIRRITSISTARTTICSIR
jgi:adenine-specific DNA-methyltransferase